MNEALLTVDELAALQARVLTRWTRTTSRASLTNGQTPTLYRGLGLELFDTRAYHPGDDIRHMDWRATARCGKPTMKVFRDERQRNIILFIDRTQTMRFGTRRMLKAAVAAQAAAIIAFSALADHETVGGFIYEDTLSHFPSSRSLDRTLHFLQRAAAPLPNPRFERSPTLFSSTLETLARTVARGSTIYLLSDFHQLHDDDAGLLLELASHHHVVALHITDPGEQSLPDLGTLRVKSVLSGQSFVINAASQTLQDTYARRIKEKHAQQQNLFNRTGVEQLVLTTRIDTFQQLGEIT